VGPTQETGPCDEPIQDIDCELSEWEVPGLFVADEPQNMAKKHWIFGELFLDGLVWEISRSRLPNLEGGIFQVLEIL